MHEIEFFRLCFLEIYAKFLSNRWLKNRLSQLNRLSETYLYGNIPTEIWQQRALIGYEFERRQNNDKYLDKIRTKDYTC